jgi:carboxyl-terminal processing protease
MRLAGLVVLLTGTIYSATSAQEPDPAKVVKPSPSFAPETLTADQRAKNVEAFDMLWTTIRDKHFDPKLGGLDWQFFFDLVNVLKQYGEAIEASRDADGLIIDLRGNPGGIGAMSFAMGGWLVSERGLKLGTLVTRDGSLNFTLFPRPRPFKAPVAVLVDELSMSTSEILAGGLKDLKRARVFGVRTPGAALPSTVEVLPNGDRFQYAFANYISANGQPLEGIGVVPDVETPWTRAALLEGRDPAVEAALCWIRSSKKTR